MGKRKSSRAPGGADGDGRAAKARPGLQGDVGTTGDTNGGDTTGRDTDGGDTNRGDTNGEDTNGGDTIRGDVTGGDAMDDGRGADSAHGGATESRSEDGGSAATPQHRVAEERSPTPAPSAQAGMDGSEQQEAKHSPDVGDVEDPQPHGDTDGGAERGEAAEEPPAKAEPTCGAEREESCGDGAVGLPHIPGTGVTPTALEHSGVLGGDAELPQTPTSSRPAVPPCPEDSDGDPASPSCTLRVEVTQREDASVVLGGLILELSNLNRRLMGAHRDMEALRRLRLRREQSWGAARRRRRRRTTDGEAGMKQSQQL